ncbi:SDR family oxidoreductase [Opitutales bacterium]|jgi:3-oxoacyl-[acyl-carrier protein] reductase|nr:SDR family oxidoreductase [Opitutales bacterium]
MKLGIKNKKALVTGGGRGIGRSIAEALAKEGARVAIVARTKADLENSLEAMGGSKCGHFGLAVDLMDNGSVDHLIQSSQKVGFNEFDIVVHNVGGTLGINDPFCSISDWRNLYRFNFEIAVEINRLLVPKMQRNNWGRVVHISSISSMENHGPVTYCSMKAALTAYTRSIGGVVAPDGVVISAVLPGAVFTEGGYWDDTCKNRPDHVKKYLTERQRIGRFGTTNEIADYVTFLCSEKASFCTGSIVPIDGGQGRGYFGQ